jgi:hypothetical protein
MMLALPELGNIPKFAPKFPFGISAALSNPTHLITPAALHRVPKSARLPGGAGLGGGGLGGCDPPPPPDPPPEGAPAEGAPAGALLAGPTAPAPQPVNVDRAAIANNTKAPR